ncbi:hypothetical protein FS837_006584 [Tulasnella sp. UAMH 9824]|nr:hypothetical protein FS837_006584 [Tulasnella sp. UAMH 9824]
MKTTAYSVALISSLIAAVNAAVAPRQACPAVVVDDTPITADATAVSGLQLGNATPINAAGIGSSAHPWKPLSWSSTESTTTWESSSGYLTAEATSDYSETSDFLACKPITSYTGLLAPKVQWLLFLNPGNTIPTVSDDTLSNANLATCVQTKLYYAGPSSLSGGSGW